MRIFLLVLAVLACLFSCSHSASPGDAFLILRKTIHSDHPQVLAEGTNFTVELTAYNVGKREAYDVTIRENWGEESFVLMDGALNRTWETMAPGDKVTLNITLNPKQSGEMSGFRGIVSYKASPDGPMIIGFSTPMPPHTVYSADLYAKATASHTVEWAVYIGGLSVFVLLPYVMQQMYHREYVHKSKSA